MAGVGVATDVDGGVGIEGVALLELFLEIGEGDGVFVDEDVADGADAEVDHVGFEVVLGGGGDGEVDADGLLFGHGEADHHEGGEEEEHHVDERDDFQSGFFDRERGVELHR